MATRFNPDEKAYRAGTHQYSVIDLLRSATEDAYMLNGLPRISDFHFKVGQPVCYRVDERLEPIEAGEPLRQEQVERMLYALLSNEALARFEADQSLDLDYGFSLDGGAFSFRLNLFRDSDGLAGVVRFLPPNILSPSAIGFTNEAVWRDIVTLKQGLVLVTGMAGCGKSTTTASLINYICEHRPVRVVTLEDPIEYVFKSKRALISQREVYRHVKSFADGLRSVLRENPDVIYVGEIRDKETAQLAMTAAETGHLVLSTLHTRDTTGAVSRILDMFPADRLRELATQLSFSLAYVVGQKLVPTVSGEGRVLALEILRNASSVGSIIRSSKLHQLYSVMETHANEGMITMEKALENLHEAGLITTEDAVLHANRDTIIDHLV